MQGSSQAPVPVPSTAPRNMSNTTQGVLYREPTPKVKGGRDAIAHVTDGAAMPFYWAANPKAAVLKLLGLGCGAVLILGTIVLTTTLVYGEGNPTVKGWLTGIFEAPAKGVRSVFALPQSTPTAGPTAAEREDAAFNGRSLVDGEGQSGTP